MSKLQIPDGRRHWEHLVFPQVNDKLMLQSGISQLFDLKGCFAIKVVVQERVA